MPTQFEENVVVAGQLDVGLLSLRAMVKSIGLCDDSKCALAILVNFPNFGDDTLI